MSVSFFPTGDAAGGSSADVGWGKHDESEERSVRAVEVEDSADGRRAAPLPRQAVTVADEPHLPLDEAEGDKDEVPHEQVDNISHAGVSSVKQRPASWPTCSSSGSNTVL